MRDRMLRKEFFDDEKLASVSFGCRLLFQGLWIFSDDYGVVKGHPVWLKGHVFPYDEIPPDEFAGWLNDLVSLGMIVPFAAQNEAFYYIVHFLDHQKIEKPSKWRNPFPPDGIANPGNGSPTNPRPLPEGSPTATRSSKVKRSKEKGSTAAVFPDIPSSVPLAKTTGAREEIIVEETCARECALAEGCDRTDCPEDEPEPTAEDLAALEDEAAPPAAQGGPGPTPAAAPPDAPPPAQEPATLALAPQDAPKKRTPRKERDYLQWIIDTFAAYWKSYQGVPYQVKDGKAQGHAGTIAKYFRRWEGDTEAIKTIICTSFDAFFNLVRLDAFEEGHDEMLLTFKYDLGFFASDCDRWAKLAKDKKLKPLMQPEDVLQIDEGVIWDRERIKAFVARHPDMADEIKRYRNERKKSERDCFDPRRQ